MPIRLLHMSFVPISQPILQMANDLIASFAF